jgi:hypothetical protein
VDAGGIGQPQLVQFTDLILDGPAIKVDRDDTLSCLTGCRQ